MIVVRRRTDDDFAPLEPVADAVFDNDGYPGVSPWRREHLAHDDVLDAWVAVVNGHVVGHVALHGSSLDVVMARAAAHVGHGRLAVVARLFTDPAIRRAGVGRALLDHASNAARARGLHAILDVASHDGAARALYESAGWIDAGEVVMRFPGVDLPSHVYVAPSAA
ncbi:MAG TPA: GNAT family N-acetyltransferase [Acidimicrobiales bacterium]|nr:GNAT family N-acetyltransferase [Acidimicrobiales bacterium]